MLEYYILIYLRHIYNIFLKIFIKIYNQLNDDDKMQK